jgi:hypothetical protein
METYKIVKPAEYLPEHSNFIENFKYSIQLLSTQTNNIIGLKDVDSKHIISTNAYAKIVALKNGIEVADRTDFDMPCPGTVQYAHQYVQEDQALINSKNIGIGISVLNVHNYSDGLKARVFKKHILHHVPTLSILGTIYSGYDVELKDFVNIIPNYIVQFGLTGSLEVINNLNAGNLPLNDYEQEICFLLLLNWEPRQIAELMNTLRPRNSSRTADTIIKKKNYICQKLHIPFNRTSDLCNFLVSKGFHTKIPQSFYSRIVGSRVLTSFQI